MERYSGVVGNVGVRLPIGYRFCPTDEEIIVHYLKKKALGLPLPASVISEFDVFKLHPGSLPGDVTERHRYFFSKSSGWIFRSKIRVGSGHWKQLGTHRPIFLSGFNQAVGIRRTLVFSEPNGSSGDTQTSRRWFLREYSLAGSEVTQPCQDWVVYSVFQKRKGSKKKQQRHGWTTSGAKVHTIDGSYTEHNDIDFSTVHSKDIIEPDSPPPCSPCSSGITQDLFRI